MTIDRSDAVNLARNVLAQKDDPEITTKGIVALAQAVLAMDEYIIDLERACALHANAAEHLGNMARDAVDESLQE